ncbi:GNAT family N-acetyltransferase [Planococcus lenghuensis]|uniref:GNAT family N-acetyltransferase n=1 Tax=Planococcus lenghuensis TaxID=2213202 RepID=A0A1Q2KUN1_9BACL|nr:GNAT family N-acetyltransferase [Planococcus lenghuensis]AQQ51853.1 GNAT family N-acetyltransferase [Planococcus lenghuensis]
MHLSYQHDLPRKEAFYKLYETTGWNSKYGFSQEQLHTAISNSYFMTCAYDGEQLVGFGRVISDGIYQTFIGDMIVHPDYQQQGIGKSILGSLVDQCRLDGIKWIQLTCAKGKMAFYHKYGFEARPADAPGMQMYL